MGISDSNPFRLDAELLEVQNSILPAKVEIPDWLETDFNKLGPSAYPRINLIDIEGLADILEVAAITGTTHHGGMMIHKIRHSTIGLATLIIGSGEGAVLIRQ